MNGTRNFTAKVDIVADGSGDETGAVIIDPANLTGTPSKFKISEISWQLATFTAVLIWDADTDKYAFALTDYGDGHINFLKQCDAPLINDAGTGVTGKLLLVTSGLGVSGDRGTIIIKGYH
jgi:hypothetical protein